MGARSDRECLLSSIDVTEEAERLRGEPRCHFVRSEIKKGRSASKCIESFPKSATSPEWMVRTVLPVMPPNCARWCRWTADGSRRRT